MKDLGAAGGGAGQQTLLLLPHQPLAGVGSHVGGHVLLGPGVQPRLEASVQAGVDPLVGLKERTAPGQPQIPAAPDARGKTLGKRLRQLT